MFELLLIKAPQDLIELAEIVRMLTTQNYESDMLTFVNASEFLIHANCGDLGRWTVNTKRAVRRSRWKICITQSI